MPLRLDCSAGNTCKTVSIPSNASGCTSAVVTSDRLLMSWVSTGPFWSRNVRSVGSSLSTCWMASASSWSELVRFPVSCARSLFNATNCRSFSCSALTNNAKLRTTAKKSPRPSPSAVSDVARLLRVVLIWSPLPAKPSAKDSMTSPNGPLGCSLVGPRSLMMRVRSLRSWSHSTGTWVRCTGITALSCSAGPPV
ncbi:hypothetical protein C1Y40_03783 [Mycobacterium talmoniae]|uniref:Uncharacterized protein n=1 Tax=Mycobacterium talmoniae TaxID=1858794 RepID=A0A2S8BH76_9MYCO|nr:hypothetical protein C1Y40_03783 [Mycobacterium talmoniae]